MFDQQGGRLFYLTQGASAFALHLGAGGRLAAVPFQISAAGGGARPRRTPALVRLAHNRTAADDPPRSIAVRNQQPGRQPFNPRKPNQERRPGSAPPQDIHHPPGGPMQQNRNERMPGQPGCSRGGPVRSAKGSGAKAAPKCLTQPASKTITLQLKSLMLLSTQRSPRRCRAPRRMRRAQPPFAKGRRPRGIAEQKAGRSKRFQRYHDEVGLARRGLVARAAAQFAINVIGLSDGWLIGALASPPHDPHASRWRANDRGCYHLRRLHSRQDRPLRIPRTKPMS